MATPAARIPNRLARVSTGVFVPAVIAIFLLAILGVFFEAWILMLVLGALGFTFWSFWMCFSVILAWSAVAMSLRAGRR